MTNKQPEALLLADVLEGDNSFDNRAAAELRRLHALNAELLKPLIAWEKAYCEKDFSMTMHQFDVMVRAAIAKAEVVQS